MNILAQIQSRFAPVLAQWVEDPAPLVAMIRPAGNPQHGDYQANCAMPLKDKLKKPPRDIAAELVAAADLSDLCEPPEIAGPGLHQPAAEGRRAGANCTPMRCRRTARRAARRAPRTIVIDYSVAERRQADARRPHPLHGDRRRPLSHAEVPRPPGDQRQPPRRLGHAVRHDHLRLQALRRPRRVCKRSRSTSSAGSIGWCVSWSTISKRSRELPSAAASGPIGGVERRLGRDRTRSTRPATRRPTRKPRRRCRSSTATRNELRTEHRRAQARKSTLRTKIPLSRNSPREHPNIEQAVLEETAKLHAGDAENLKLWREFLPALPRRDSADLRPART